MPKFYTEYVDHAYAVMVKYPGISPREAWHNWFTDEKNAREVARLLNNGTIKYIHPCAKERGEACEICQSITNSYVKKELQYA
jgi:hypothetical protein